MLDLTSERQSVAGQPHAISRICNGNGGFRVSGRGACVQNTIPGTCSPDLGRDKQEEWCIAAGKISIVRRERIRLAPVSGSGYAPYRIEQAFATPRAAPWSECVTGNTFYSIP